MMKLVLLLSLLLFVFISEGGASILDRAKPKGDSTPTTPKPTEAKDTTTTPRPVDSTPKPTPKPAESTPKPVDSTPKPTPKPAESTPKPAESTPKPAESTPKPAESTPKPVESTPKPTTKDGQSTTPKEEKTTTRKDDHGEEKCENLEVCTQYSRCAEILYTGDECEGTCSKCIDTASYGSCEYFRNKKGDDLTIQCYGDEDIQKVPHCRSKVCDQYSSPDKCLSTEYCAWVEEGDQCIGDFCGHCIYTHVGCEKHKECYDRSNGRKTRIHRCSVDDVQYDSCDIERPPCAECKDLPYDQCIGDDGCAWVDVTNYYDDSNCPTECGYCKPTCEYGGNNTCAQAQWYYECIKEFEDDSSGTGGGDGDSGSSGSGSDGSGSGGESSGSGTDESEDGEKDTSSGDGGSSKSERKIYCEGDEPPENVGRCFVKDYLVDDTTDKKLCKDLTYEECINAAAVDNTGGCAFVVTSNCGRACGRCVSIGIACSDHKKCHDSSSEGSQTETYYCDFDETPAATDCVQKYCNAKDAESCLGESDQCVWYQFKGLDYRCGWCSFVCDSCEKEQKRVANAYGNSEFFNGGKYDAICKKDDDKLIKDCYKCYGKKSQCANAFCLDQVKSCNADKTCSDRAFKVMCMEFGENEGSIFYEKLVKEENKNNEGEGKAETGTNEQPSDGSGHTGEDSSETGEDDGITDNEAILNFGQCMKKACFEDNDEEIIEEFNSQTSLEPVCSFGYAELDYAIDICLDSASIADLCKENYARNFKDVIETDKEAKIYWRYLDTGCNVFYQSSRRMIEETTKVDTGDVADPWNRITESTETPEGIPESENCLSIEISITYPTKEAYQNDKDKYATIEKKINKLKSDATVLIDTWTIECCKEDDVCQNMQGSSVAVSTLFAIVAALATLLFV